MTTVSFYKLNNRTIKEKKICEIAENFYNQGKRILIFVTTKEEEKTLDELLWKFTPESFVPHKISTTLKIDKNQPVLITTKKENRNRANALILAREVDISFILQFDEVIDFAEIYDKNCLQRSRTRYTYYLSNGLNVNYHEQN